MSDSREGSPDWLRLFQPPSIDVTTLSSGSDSSPVNNSKRSAHAKPEPRGRKNKRDSIKIDIGEESLPIKTEEPTDAKHENDQILSQDALRPNNEEPMEESTQEKPAGSSVSRLPLVFTDKVQRSKALVECDGDSIDLSGDVGAVGRIVISNGPTGNNELLLDLKGTVYKTTIVPSRTFCVVSIGQSEAKIEAIMNDFIQLEPKSNVFEAETMVEGTLDGFSFDSEEETDKVTKNPVQQSGQTNEDGDHTDKAKDSVRKKARMIATPAKKGSKKPQVLKRTRKSKK